VDADRDGVVLTFAVRAPLRSPESSARMSAIAARKVANPD
jgi:hypothetical protein